MYRKLGAIGVIALTVKRCINLMQLFFRLIESRHRTSKRAQQSKQQPQLHSIQLHLIDIYECQKQKQQQQYII